MQGLSISENLNKVKERLVEAEKAAGVAEGSVTLIAVTKTRTPAQIEQVLDEGILDLGENRLQEAGEKIPVLAHRSPHWHFIGHLQRNKVKNVVGIFDLIQSVDSVRLANEIDKKADLSGIRQRVLIQVNTSGEESKFGCDPGRVDELMEVAGNCENIMIEGFMTIGPLTDNEIRIIESFSMLRKIFEKYKKEPPANADIKHLSMGMSHDFELAIREGANMVRVGTDIFGPRPAY